MKRIILTLLLIFFISNNSPAQWFLQYSDSNYANLNSIQFINENTGFIVGFGHTKSYSYIYKTVNGGTNWIKLNLPSNMNTFLYDLSFLNAITGFVCGYSRNIFKTTDGGYNWTFTTAPWINVTQTYDAIQFFNEQTGYIGGRYGMRNKTTNGGINWINLDTAYADISSLYFLDINTGFMGDTYSTIYKTTDGGLTWSYQYLTDTVWNSGYAFNKIKFADYNTGYVVGSNVNNGALFKTTNSGISWKSILVLHDNPLYSLEVSGSSTVYAGSKMEIIYKSTNAGLNWTNQQLPTQWANAYSIFFINENTGFSVAGGDIMKTTNGGSVFINKLSTEVLNNNKMYQNYPNLFNPSTKIKFDVVSGFPLGAYGNYKVVLKVFDILGREVATLVNEQLSPGTYSVDWNASAFPSGVYFYKLESGNFTETKRMVLIK